MSTEFGSPPAASPEDRSGNGSMAAHRSEFGAFLDDLSELARGSGAHGDLRGELERRIEEARGRMAVAFDHGMEMSARARDRMQRGLEHSREAVAERPLSSLAMAAVAGLIVGLLLARRD